MSWLDFFADAQNFLSAAKLLNRERSRNIVTPPFTIQALETPPSDTVVVIIADKINIQHKHGVAVFDINGGDELWRDTVRRMISYINDQPQCVTFLIHGIDSVLVVPPLHPRHVQVLLPHSVDPHKWASVVAGLV